jgi:hypothetical protein
MVADKDNAHIGQIDVRPCRQFRRNRLGWFLDDRRTLFRRPSILLLLLQFF